ncbi:MAG: glycosyltransferase family 4 protein [Gemmatimonadales bacterium]
MRLLFVSHSLPPLGRPMENVGGMQRAALDLHDGLLAHRGVSATALVLRSPWNERAYRTPIFLASALREIRSLARQREIDAILFSSMVTAALAVPLRRLLRRSGIVSAAIVNGLDATTTTWPYPHLVRKIFESVDVALPISHATAIACEQRGLSRSRCKVVNLGIRLDRFSPRARVEAREQLLSIAASHGFPATASPRLILSSVGRLVPRKGVAWFVESVMPQLPKDVVYLVAGDGPDRFRIDAAIEQNKLESRVKLLGAISDSELEVLYHGSDLFMMPNVPVANDMEGLGLVMLEAGLTGTPTIASRLEGIADVVTEGENGHLVESGNAAGFRDAVMRYYEDADALAEVSVRARLFTAARFGWGGVIDRYIEIIGGLR